MKKSGSVTVFLALVFTCVSALILALAESARTAGARFYLQNMANSSIDSLFSEYNRALWDSYRLILLESRDDEKTTQELSRFMAPYTENCGWFALTAPTAEIIAQKSITDDGGVWFEKEVMDYMKYGWITLDHTPESAEDLWKQTTEANALHDITEAYGLRSKEAIKMEKAIKKIVENLTEQQKLKDKARSELLSGRNSSFQRTSDSLKKKIRDLPNLITDYDKKADDFGTHLAEVKTEHAEAFEKLEPENREMIEEQIRSFADYTDQNGARRTELDALDDNSENTLTNITLVQVMANETADYISDADEDDDIDEDELWREVASSWNTIRIPHFGGPYGVRDEEKEGLLASVSDFAGNGFLKLVVPKGKTVSEGKIDTSLFPSMTSVTARTDDGPNLLTRASVDEYAGKFLPNFLDESKRSVAYEMEYIIAGQDTDQKNLTGALLQILAVRQGLNFLHIMRSSTMRSEARELAMFIAGSTALPALALLIECLIITVWALAESLMDLHLLLKGKKIALIKSNDDWMLSLSGLLTLASSGTLSEENEKENKTGIGYESYLKLLLFIKSSEEKNYRIMDMQQMNIQTGEPGFLMKNCIYGMNIEVTCESRHLFTLLGISAGESFSLSPDFSMSAETAKAY